MSKLSKWIILFVISLVVVGFGYILFATVTSGGPGITAGGICFIIFGILGFIVLVTGTIYIWNNKQDPDFYISIKDADSSKFKKSFSQSNGTEINKEAK
ncbi:MAG: hypothetical protein LBL60_03425 [Mycoplasmataceae bacterium]|jgi:ABC-type transport system involved in multi-copper enzyme maturation permease subunit|nr:hypothetical protein [Mycoplasmataceae bacterium]